LTLINHGVGKEVLEELKRTLSYLKDQPLDGNQAGLFTEAILKNPLRSRIFVTGKGRSGFMGEAFAMRLVHLGFNATVVGETTAPPISKGDAFLVISGSGENRTKETETAKKLGAKIILITSQKDSTLGRLSDVIMIIPGRGREDPERTYSERRLKGIPVVPLGTVFEDLTLLFLDSVIGYIAAAKGQSEKDTGARHDNL